MATFVEFLKISEQSFPCFLKFDEIYLGLREKQHSINKRTAYTDIIYSSGDKRAAPIETPVIIFTINGFKKG